MHMHIFLFMHYHPKRSIFSGITEMAITPEIVNKLQPKVKGLKRATISQGQPSLTHTE
jgi:hypothetical protein